jgi:hypothetical protein
LIGPEERVFKSALITERDGAVRQAAAQFLHQIAPDRGDGTAWFNEQIAQGAMDGRSRLVLTLSSEPLRRLSSKVSFSWTKPTTSQVPGGRLMPRRG